MATTGIAWTSDVQTKFNNIDSKKVPGYPDKGWRDVQWLDMEDEHFIVWMRTSGIPNFRKLWGRIEVDLQPGTYFIEIENNYNVADFAAKKFVVFASQSILGGKNTFLAICYIAAGSMCIVFALILLLLNFVFVR